MINFSEILEGHLDLAALDARTCQLSGHHPDRDDCRLVAEVEAFRVDVLVTFDGDLIDHLQPHTAVAPQTPSACWAVLGIPRGTPPRQTPAPGHPLFAASWWPWT